MLSKDSNKAIDKVNQKVKIAIVGAGLGGLAVACRLAKMGFEILVFEQSELAGGKAGSLVLKTKKGLFRFDTGPSLMTMSEVFQDLFAFCGEKMEDYLDLEELHVSTKYFFEDGSVILGYKDRNRLIDEIKQKTTANPNNFEKYLNQNQKIYELTREVFLDNEIGTNTLFNPKFWEGVLNISLLRPWQSMHSQNQNLLKDQRLVQIADRYATFNGSNPYKAPATLNVIAHIDLSLPTYFPKKGIYAISQSIQNLALKMGVKIFYQSKVLAINHGSEAPVKKAAKNTEKTNFKTGHPEEVYVGEDASDNFVNNIFNNYFNNIFKVNSSDKNKTESQNDQKNPLNKDLIKNIVCKNYISGVWIQSLEYEGQIQSGSKTISKTISKPASRCASKTLSKSDLSFVQADFLVSNVDILTTYLDIAKETNYKPINKRLKQEFSSSTLVYYWAVDRNNLDLDVHNILFSSDYKQEFDDIFGKYGFSSDPTVYIHIGSKIDKDSAPKGCESWFVMVNVGSDNGQNWLQVAEDLKPVIYQKINRLILDRQNLKNSKIANQVINIKSSEWRKSEWRNSGWQDSDTSSDNLNSNGKNTNDSNLSYPNLNNLNSQKLDSKISDSKKSSKSPSIENLILAESILTPDLVAKKTGSYKGSLYGLSSNNPFSAFQRYPNQSKKYQNLYFVGGSTHPGGGMPLVLNSAKIVADKIFKKLKI
jgi:phytoene dehydrogenase-like protein